MSEQMDACTVLIESAMERVKYYIRKITENPIAGTRTGAVLDDALSSSGKMIRPRLLLLCASLGPDFEKNLDRLCMMAALTELTHLASLIHDDIVDDAPSRRGKPSIQGKYGKDAAVYAGDFIIARINYWEAKEHLNNAARILANAVENMCIGEIGQATCRYREDVSTEDYLANIRGKTAILFRSACEIGASEAGCSGEVVERLAGFGENLGIMFQYRDDLLDFTSSEGEIGKETHKDFLEGIYTLPVLNALKDPDGRAKLLPIIRENAERVLNVEEIREMEQLVVRYGGIESTWEQIHACADRSEKLLSPLAENAAVKEIKKILYLLDKR